MVTISDVFREDNINLAMEDLLRRPNTCGVDGVLLSELPDYWKVNQAEIIGSIREMTYSPGPVRLSTIVNKKGKRRMIATMNSIDRLICRALVQVLELDIEPHLSDVCFSYRRGKSALDAANLAASYMQKGLTWVGELDVENYFDTIPRDRMVSKISEIIQDYLLVSLIKCYVYQSMESDGEVYQSDVGLIQGSPLSPLLSNLYLADLDKKLLEKDISFYRYGDDINIYASSFEEANEILLQIKTNLNQLGLSVNVGKGGVFLGINRKCLGYEFVEQGENILVQRVFHKKHEIYRHWTQSSVKKIGNNYHLVNDGILTKKDFNILFENADGKRFVPVETVDSLNVYSNCIFSGSFFDYMNSEQLSVNFYNRYGNKIGTFIPNKWKRSIEIEQSQIALIGNEKEHLKIAKKYQNANIFNIRAVLRYYQRRMDNPQIDETVNRITEILKDVNEQKSIENLMIYEAQARQMYFRCFNVIMDDEDYKFVCRTKRPPKDALNAMISFGNTLLYQRFASEIYASKLDIRFGLLHSSKHRTENLNLDLADLFKPIIVDRTIFTLVNKKMLDINTCFRNTNEEGVYLSEVGKRVFIREFELKLNQKINFKGQNISYEKILKNEVKMLQKYFQNGEKYQPYKYVN